MAKIKDLTGQRFGKLIAINPTKKRTNGGYVIWRCLCDCDNVCYVSSHSLCLGRTRSCGCIPRGFPKGKLLLDLTGQRFGKLEVIRPTNDRLAGSVIWECKCDCGNTCLVSTVNLRSGRTKSCGCAMGRSPVDLAGVKFGILTAIEPTDKRVDGFVVWKCRCDCGNICYCPSGYLNAGRIISCGCLKP